MPEFDYQAVDAGGRLSTGRMAAASANDVVLRLSQQGLAVQGLNIVAGHGGVAPAAVGGQRVTPIVQANSGAGTHSAPVAQYSYSQAARPIQTTRQKLTGFFKDYDLWMLLNQMGVILRSGISATEMLKELSTRRSIKAKACRAMEDMAKLTAQGMSLSDAMEVYPEIFPDGVVGSVRAGEAGGYLPDALLHTSEQIQASWKVRRHYLWTSLSIFSTVILIPFMPVMHAGSDALGRYINSNNPEGGSPVSMYFDAWFHALMGWPVVGMLAITGLFLFGPYLFGRIWFLPLRHALAAKLPLIGRRTRSESSRELSYHLQRLSIAGVSPYRAFGLAAAAIPNKVYRERMVEYGRPFREDTPLSQIIPRKLMPDEWVDLIRTGELTGTTPDAMQQVERIAQGDQKMMENVLKVKAWVWVGLFVFGVSSIVAALMMRDFYDVMWKAIFEGTGW